MSIWNNNNEIKKIRGRINEFKGTKNKQSMMS